MSLRAARGRPAPPASCGCFYFPERKTDILVAAQLLADGFSTLLQRLQAAHLLLLNLHMSAYTVWVCRQTADCCRALKIYISGSLHVSCLVAKLSSCRLSWWTRCDGWFQQQEHGESLFFTFYLWDQIQKISSAGAEVLLLLSGLFKAEYYMCYNRVFIILVVFLMC